MDAAHVVLAAAAAAALAAAAAVRTRARRAETRIADLESRLGDLADAGSGLTEDRDDLLRSIDALGDGVVLLDAAGRVRVTNPAAEDVLGGRPASAATFTPAALRTLVEQAATGPVTADVEVGAPTRVIRGSARRIDDDGDVLLVLRDVTESVRIDAVRRDFVANASHELKTPLATIRATAETLRTAIGDDPAAAATFAARVEDEAERLSRIVSDLLDLSRLEGGAAGADEVALGTIARDEAARLGPEAEARRIEVRVDAAGDGPTVTGSERDLRLMVRNLVENAVRYSEDGGHVAVTVRAADGEAVVEVRDDGVGIPTRDLPRVFERFYRVDRARARETGGTGLGLAIVRHVAENHGGRVSIESELGRGTTVEVRVPVRGGSP